MWMFTLLWVAQVVSASMPYCSDAVPCKNVTANEFTFQCRFAGQQQGTPVILLHGFPCWSYWWLPLLTRWATGDDGLYGVACDMRGYSPGASPDDPALYTYAEIATDVWAIADALGFQQFHLAGHDHGAGLGWTAAAAAPALYGGGRLLSYTAFSVPHIAAFNLALAGPEPDEAQQVASTYFNQFSLADSATRNNESLSQALGYGQFQSMSAADFQRALWWYNGMLGTGARPPVVSKWEILKYPQEMPFILAVQSAIPLPVAPAVPAVSTIGNVTVPTMYACGSNDHYLLCTRPSMKRTAEFVSAEYVYRNFSCGHDFFTVGGDGCQAQADVDNVIEAVTSFMLSH
eukprot:CAMPEP_0183342232 /NCGR_PEP_ID=MMETSP0164_2-20130417/8376_1 /TAXON_ID=221442 /ORGANISM="Coccolithus pelagicus ssp braarudi, Strain PLY182g" /LENGTH=345 /DNA_ID=CAMNT_0025512755 /DNA_START=73 /DNA_END=1110 /DNA_ORIENTATION=-